MVAQAQVGPELEIVDCDAHFTEPPDLWTSRAPTALRDRVPIQRNVDGITGWFLDGELWASTGGNVIGTGGHKKLGQLYLQPFEAIDPAAWSVPHRLALMDRMSIDTQIVYPNGIGFASNHLFAIDDADLRLDLLRIYNDFLVDIQVESDRRLLPQAILPIWDMQETCKEMGRLLDRGISGFTLSDKPELLGLPELPRPYFDPMWDLMNESGAVANFHIGAGATKEEMNAIRAGTGDGFRDDLDDVGRRQPPPMTAPLAWNHFGVQRRVAVRAAQMSMSNIRIITNLCMGDLFDRYPNLRVVSAESGIGWVPFMLESMEYQLDQMVTNPDELRLQDRRPTEYFKDHIFVTFWFERFGPTAAVESIGAQNILLETDIPHPTCLYPDALHHFEDVLQGLSDFDRRCILRENAARLYGISTARH